MNKNKFKVSAAPHIHEPISVKSVMWQVAIALVPALIVAVMFFGINALLLTLWGVIGAVATEALIQKFRKVEVTITDGSAVVTGMLISFNLHAASPWWLPVVGSVFAISIGKHVFGGLGKNIFNPALLGRAFLVASWPTLTTSGWIPTKFNSINGIIQNDLTSTSVKATEFLSSATPLNVVKTLRDSAFVNGLSDNLARSQSIGDYIWNNLQSSDVLNNLFLGNTGGVIGEISVAALLIGAAWLFYKKIIEWRIPVSYLSTVFILIYLFGGKDGFLSASIMLPVFHLVAGGLMLGALFMATDMVTSPVTKRGRLIFGIGCGVFTVAIRLVGGYPEGVSYSILLMNMFVPLIDKLTIPKPFGEVKK